MYKTNITYCINVKIKVLYIKNLAGVCNSSQHFSVMILVLVAAFSAGLKPIKLNVFRFSCFPKAIDKEMGCGTTELHTAQ